MKSTVRRIVIFAVCFVLVLGLYFAYRLVLAKRVEVPHEFTSARSTSAIISQDIVNASNGLVEEIKKINDLEAAGKYKEAIQATEGVISRVAEIRARALDLSKELEAMAVA